MKNWKKLLKDKKAYCYIKPNRHVHDSGFRCFEVGYCTIKNKKVKDKYILSEGSDHFYHWNIPSCGYEPLDFNMDILLDGYIRLFSSKAILTWENNYKWVVSSFGLEKMK